jgi:hypothetical protein
MVKKNSIPIIDYIGKYAEIKKKVKLFKSDITQSHYRSYKIVNQNKKRTWICLQSKLFAAYISSVTNKLIEETINKSFWMKVNECKII